jgi:hypothetical protein
VTGRCAGIPTSTFGGGGGTKLFWSHPLRAMNADRPKAKRDTAADLFGRLFGLMLGEPAGFISVPRSSYSRELRSEEDFPPSENSNNPLAVEPESENDADRKNL